MGSHSVHLETATGNYVVVKDGQVLHSFPSEGEAMLQVQYLDEQEKAAKREAKAEGVKAEAEAKNDKHDKHEDEPRHTRSESSAGGRHR